ncbi:MAG: hypothetical protein IPJ67_02910 [Candidatus Moraniibacteriota bacterium]|nr:MAG: hypothetical protein IPJ67_02910 [Candidatus Moranbacteria bacterium]
MKVKLLLFPLSIVIALAVGVFWIQPGISSALMLRTQDSQAQARLDQMDQVIANIDTLDSSLTKNDGDRQFVETYLPKMGSDDVIIDEVNFLAGESGILLVSTDLKSVSSDLTKAAALQVQAESDRAEVAANSPGSLLNTGMPSDQELLFTKSSPDARVRSTEVSVSVLGKYDQIKAFVDRVYHANHFQGFVSVDIAEKPQGKTEVESADVAPDVLSADMVIRFGVLPETTLSSGVLLDTFKTSAFDLAVVQDLRGRVTTELPMLDATPSERPNPFVR